jgi:hypothetical protein
MLFIDILLIMYILGEINMTKSSYGVRIARDVKTYNDARYYNWFQRQSDRLEQLYLEEYCKTMQLPFDKFCLAIYTGDFQITYKT